MKIDTYENRYFIGVFILLVLFLMLSIAFLAYNSVTNKIETVTVTVTMDDINLYTVIDKETGLKHRVVLIDRGPLLLSSEPYNE